MGVRESRYGGLVGYWCRLVRSAPKPRNSSKIVKSHDDRTFTPTPAPAQMTITFGARHHEAKLPKRVQSATLAGKLHSDRQLVHVLLMG